MKITLILVPLLAAGCVVEECNEDAVAMGGVCFPENLGPGSMCGNGLCERSGRPQETAASCPADCDGGYQLRATTLWLLSANYYNAHVANRQWPAGMFDTNGACEDGGTASGRGVVGTIGDDTSYQLELNASGCSINFGNFVTLRVEGGPFSDNSTFNNVRETGTSQLRGSATMSGVEEGVPFPTAPCSFDFTRVRSGTTAMFSGTFCGKELRRIFYDGGS